MEIIISIEINAFAAPTLKGGTTRTVCRRTILSPLPNLKQTSMLSFICYLDEKPMSQTMIVNTRIHLN